MYDVIKRSIIEEKRTEKDGGNGTARDRRERRSDGVRGGGGEEKKHKSNISWKRVHAATAARLQHIAVRLRDAVVL